MSIIVLILICRRYRRRLHIQIGQALCRCLMKSIVSSNVVSIIHDLTYVGKVDSSDFFLGLLWCWSCSCILCLNCCSSNSPSLYVGRSGSCRIIYVAKCPPPPKKAHTAVFSVGLIYFFYHIDDSASFNATVWYSYSISSISSRGDVCSS